MKHKDISNNDDASILAKAITSAADKVNSLQAQPSGAIFIPLDPDLKPDAKNGLVLGAPAYQSGGIAIMNNDGEMEPFVDTRQINDDIKDANRNAQSAIDAAAQASQSAQQADNNATSAQNAAKQAQQDAATARQTADNAQHDATTAQQNATSAQQGASQAQKDANKAQQDATQALSAANSALTKTASVQQDATNALKNANSALARATNITTSPTAPSNPREQDIWYPTDSNNHVIGMKQYVGGRWQDVTLMASQILVPGSVGPTTIADGSITTSKLVTGAVTADKIAAGSISADKIAANSITADKLNGRKLIGAEIYTADPDKDSHEYSTYMHLQSVDNSNLGLGYAGYLSFDVSNPGTNHGSHSIGALTYAIRNDVPVPQGEFGRWDRKENNWYVQSALSVGQSGMGVKVNEMYNPRGNAVGNAEDKTNFPNCAYVEIQAPTIQFTAHYMPYHSFSSDASGYLSAHRTLFHNDNQPSAGVITLDDDITRYWKLEFEFKTNDGVYFGMPVYRPSVGKRFNASTIWYGFDNLPWLKTRAYVFQSSRTLDCVSENNGKYWRTGQQVMGRDWKVTNGDFISVTHVEGFFN